ncbi:transglutaminase family protein [Muricoccus radiodurans]|uniref:transglutaminase family protein n=1 Tax=Muricoccus radiodurans TaxID=2231721 RepID=UPI003CE83C02
MRYRVRHTTRYAYGGSVDLGAQMLHLMPRDLPGRQRVIDAAVRTEPNPARRAEGTDHFGNRVTWLFLDRPHPEFEVSSEALVEVGFPAPPPAAETPAWEAVAAAARAGGDGAWEAAEFAFGSSMAPAHAGAGEYARPSFPPGRPVLEALLELNARIRREFTFRAGVTTIATPISEILERRHGVCQDFTHLMLGALRALGLPARYVSGYIRTHPPPGKPKRQGSDQSHAWVGCWMGPEAGWVDLDPTNNLVVRDEHVVIGWGRDYADISPVRGIVLGGGAKHGLEVSVDLEPA